MLLNKLSLRFQGVIFYFNHEFSLKSL